MRTWKYYTFPKTDKANKHKSRINHDTYTITLTCTRVHPLVHDYTHPYTSTPVHAYTHPYKRTPVHDYTHPYTSTPVYSYTKVHPYTSEKYKQNCKQQFTTLGIMHLPPSRPFDDPLFQLFLTEILQHPHKTHQKVACRVQWQLRQLRRCRSLSKKLMVKAKNMPRSDSTEVFTDQKF